MHRNQGGSRWQSKALTLLAASVLGGAATGVLLGTAGGLLAPAARIAAASVLGVAAMTIGASELAGHVPLLQCDRETPQPWMQHGALRWALRNGLTLGCGATTRLGFWLWYVIPASALLSGDARVGALLYAGYGTARGAAALLLLALMRFGKRPLGRDDVAIWVLEQRTLAQRLAGACLLTVGASVAAALGV